MQYMGGKSRISKQIAEILNSAINKDTPFVSLFCGSCAIESKVQTDVKILNDKHPYLIAMWQALQNGWTPPDVVTKEEYYRVKANMDENPALTGFVGFGCSFGGKWWGGYPRGFKADGVTPRDITNEAIRNIKKQAPKLKGIFFVCGDFWKLGVGHMVIYCDPPYRDTTKYATSDFDYDKFYAWCKEMAKTNIVLISEYWMPDDGFECIWEGKLKCTLDKASRTDKTEKLYRCIPCKQ